VKPELLWDAQGNEESEAPMHDLRTILCPVDFSEATAFGLNVAGSLARRFDADLYLLHVVTTTRLSIELPIDAREAYDRWSKEASRRLDELSSELRASGVRTRVQMGRGVPYEGVVRAVEQNDAGLVVMPTHGRPALDRLFYGSVAERVVRTSRRPVLTVPPALEGMGEFAPRKIFVAVALSSNDESTLDAAIGMARAYGADLVLGHVFTYAHLSDEGPEWWWPTLTADQVSQAMSESARRLESLAERLQKAGFEVATDLSEGASPAAEIVRIVQEESPALVVVGAGGGGLLRRALLGRTAEKLLRTCPVPLLTVPADEPEATGEGHPALVPA
jgi:nucleotide-binding universal stress UspA family protein